MIYVIIFALLVCLSLTNAQRAYWPVLIFLFLFVAFRFEVGCDWLGYLNQYRVFGVKTLEDSLTEAEPIWKSAFVGQNFLGIAYPWINVFAATIFFAGIHSIARRLANPLSYLALLFPVLILNMPMGAISQGAAIGIMCFAFLAFVDRQTIRYVVFVFIAAGFHSSAAIFLLLAPLVSGQITRQRLVLAALLALPGIAVLLTGEAASVANQRYVETDRDAAGAVFRVLQVTLVGLVYFLFLKRRWPKDGQFDKLVYVGALIMLAIPALLPISTIIGDRVAYYLLPIQAIILARLPYLDFGKSRRLIIAMPYFALFVTLAVWTTISTHFEQCFLPYQSWMAGFPHSAQYLY